MNFAGHYSWWICTHDNCSVRKTAVWTKQFRWVNRTCCGEHIHVYLKKYSWFRGDKSTRKEVDIKQCVELEMLVAGKFEIEAQFQRPFLQIFFIVRSELKKFINIFFLFTPCFDFMRAYFQAEIINYMYLIQGSVWRKLMVTFFFEN